MKSYNVNHITSSPHYLQSNGLAEKYMQIVKQLFYKAKEEGKFLQVSYDLSQYPLTGSMQLLMHISKAEMLDLTCPLSDLTIVKYC